MNQRYFTFFLFACLFVLRIHAQISPQEKIIDSLKRSIPMAQHDTIRAAKLDLISFYYQHINPDSGVVYAQASFLLAQKANWKRGQILALMDLSNNYRAKSLFAEGIEKGEVALTLLETEKMPQVEMAVLTNISLLYKDLGYHGKALEYLYKALELEKQSEKKQNLPIILENIGSLYMDQENYARSDSLFDLALSMQMQRGDSAGLARNLSNKARLEQKKNNTFRAIELFQQALAISVQGGNLNSMQVMYSNLGIAYANLKLYDSAILFHEQALGLSESLHSDRSIAINAGNLGQAWYNKALEIDPALGSRERAIGMKNAEKYLSRACEIGYASNFRGPFLEFSDYLTQIYLEKGDFKEAANILGKRLMVMKLVDEDEEKIKMIKLESQRTLELKEVELTRNKQNLEISELKLGIEKRNMFAIILVFVFLATLGIVILLYLKKRGDHHKSLLNTISISHSHEIRGPLARIMGLTDLLKNDQLDERERDFICKSIEHSAKELDRNISVIIYKSSHETE
ncbi:MAG: tetratricopeptide repeat protein [Bacteroidia bacterium]